MVEGEDKKLIQDDEKSLIERLRYGEKDALWNVYEMYGEYLLTLAFSLLYDKSLAEDVLHDIFVKFAGRSVKLRLRVSLKNYLRACVVNRIRDLHSERRFGRVNWRVRFRTASPRPHRRNSTSCHKTLTMPWLNFRMSKER